MLNRKIFANRIKILRLSHELSVSQLAELLSLKSKGSISAFEAQRGFPSCEILIRISSLFAISLDWLTGRSNIPYTNEILLHLEKQKFSEPEFTTYFDETIRQSIYSLPIRANIIFISKILMISTLADDDTINPAGKSADNTLTINNTAILNYLASFQRKKHISLDMALSQLLSCTLKIPVFDIEIPIK